VSVATTLGYMATTEERRTMENRGLLTADDRAFFNGEKKVDNPDKVVREKRYNIRRRIERIEEDLRILREADENDVVEDFYESTGRYERLERELAELRNQISEE
jgi:polyhydroxyalkanoate synthesis regulator phasin